MRASKWTLIAIISLLPFVSFGQLRKVFIEKYYISDFNDAQDTIGGQLAEGAVTYRIFLELELNARVKSIFGDDRHAFHMASSEVFFNNVSQGKSFGKDFTKASLSENTVALDSYLTIGQIAKQGSKVYFALPKVLDNDGSFIGGNNNDGGSAAGQGLLSSINAEAGIPVTVSDGFDTLLMNPISWTTTGVQDVITGSDTTIFGSEVAQQSFESQNFYLTASEGVRGINADSNFVMVAQLTTSGDISFSINAEIEFWENNQWNTMRYVSADTLLASGEVYNPFLKYPYSCGCMDPAYLEYSPAYVCALEGACQNLIVYGCSDSMACNYNVDVNVHVQELCCYPGSCNNRDLVEVCPTLLGANAFELSVFPNPASEFVNVNVLNANLEDTEVLIYNANGALMFTQQISQAPHNLNVNVDVSGLNVGLYQVVVRTNSQVISKMFFKA